MMYRIFRPLLFWIDAEQAHETTILLASKFGAVLGPLLSFLYAFRDKRLKTNLWGIDFENPVGLAAGFDKDARLLGILPSLGFGFVEVGTVTPLPQSGNPKPRLFRVTEDQAILNRMGFNGRGVVSMQDRLRRRSPSLVLGVNIGKNKTTGLEDAAKDYEECFKALGDHADFIVVNVSSPNTPGLRDLQHAERLREILTRLKKINDMRVLSKPILLKIAPDLTDIELADIVKVAEESHASGIIATNTTVARCGLSLLPKEVRQLGDGGISGAPLRDRSTEIIRKVYRLSKGKLPIVGVGGVFSAADAYEKIKAGASLVEVYSGFVYEGPSLVKTIKRGLVEFLRQDGFTTVAEAVGSGNQ